MPPDDALAEVADPGLVDARRSDEMDRRIVARFAAGDADAARDMYRRYRGPVFGIAYRALRDRGLSEEVVQQTFLQAWRAADRLDPDRDPGPWMYTIARRVVIDIHRRERRHQASDPLEREIAVLPESFETLWAAWEVRTALEQLPGDEREVLRATHYLGLTHTEAAERLGVPIGTVKSRSFRAYRRLAELLAHLEEATG